MNSEREIIIWWLNKSGFFTINSIKVARNREIDFIAIKITEGNVEKILHVESACSVSSMDSLKAAKYAERFNDKLVVKKVREMITTHVGKEMPYEKLLVIGVTTKLSEFKKLQETEGLAVKEFRDIIFDVFETLDRQNYFNNTIRTLQLVKFILLAGPKRLAQLLHMQDKHKAMKKTSMKQFIMDILDNEDTVKALRHEGAEDLITQILKNSSLNKPEKLAKVLGEEIISPRARKLFVETLLAQEPMKKHKPVPKLKPRLEKSLKSFFG